MNSETSVLPWIAELRGRLSDPVPQRFDRDGDRRVVVLPLFVDARELWAMLIRRPGEEGSIVEVGLPGVSVSDATDPWSVARSSAAMDLGLQEGQVVPLGNLDEVEAIDGQPTLTCVAAIPHPLPEAASAGERAVEMLPIPLTALANPRLVEEQWVEVGEKQRGFVVLHVGRRRIAGSTAAGIQLLLERLELG